MFGGLTSALHSQVQTMSKYLRHSRSKPFAAESEPLLSEASPFPATPRGTTGDSEGAQAKGKASDFSTVASLLSSMTGAGVLSLPWAFARCGLVGALAVTAATALVMTYTCVLLLNIARERGAKDFTQLCAVYMGDWAAALFVGLTSGGLFCGIIVAYFVFIFSSVYSLGHSLLGSWLGGLWNPEVACAVTSAVVLSAMMALDDLPQIVRLGSLGVLWLGIVVSFVLWRCLNVIGEDGLMAHIPPDDL